ncbi:UNVERIFIED_CONTAM: Kinesin-like protein KIN-14I [Sesamum radiatum]|uniref:Kinesin-like protein KIN-14I n=1 Tax=Sesamum radiatum TaxID=300843 RepID=A0AAW2UR39_SESRA
MAALEGALSFSVASVVEDVLQQHGGRSRGLDLDARRAEEAAIRRYEAAAWLRKVVGVVSAKDLPAEPSEEEFRLGLRSGIILCNALNKVQPGAVPKVVESPYDSSHIPDGAALSAYQYFENVRNFLVAVEEMGMPTFEASDLEQGGKSSRVVNCVLALKSYNEWKTTGGNGVWKFGGNVKTSPAGKQFVRKNSEPFTGSLSRSMSINERSQNGISADTDFNRTVSSSSLSMLVRAILLDKKPEEVPNLIESVLSKVVEEFENRVASQMELKKASFRDFNTSHGSKSVSKPSASNVKYACFGDTSVSSFLNKTEQNDAANPRRDDIVQKHSKCDEESESRLMKQQLIVDQQQEDITVLKQTLSITKTGLHIHGLVHAASGYHRVLEENRKLYNQVQDLKGSIRVYCRVRPFLPGQFDYLSTVDHIEEGTISINTPAKNGKARKSFNFNKVFGPSATQGRPLRLAEFSLGVLFEDLKISPKFASYLFAEEVFSDTQPLIRSVLDGYNVCIFAYGQTGSGKTYTMTGPKELTDQSQGVNYRALRDLFLLADQRKDTFCYNVSVQMIEIYNEQTGLSVPDASLVRVSSTSDIIDLMNLGQRNRAVGATALNDRSSRSHSCLTVHVQGRDLTSGNIIRGCMHLVDLAGSERVDKSEVTGDRLKEAQHINKSLSALGDVISSLAQKSSHVPYRNSKLTQLLQDSLGGQAKTLMFVHISPEPDAIGETISTLKFAERVATVELGAARVNKDSADVKGLKEQIASLKAALARKDGEPVSQQQKISGSPCSMQPSFLQPNLNASLQSPNGLRKPMEDVGNIEVHRNSASRQKRQSLDLDELLGNSPTWPSVNSPCQNNGDDERELISSGEWVDKLMVNKQDPVCGDENPLATWQPNNSNISDAIYQKYLSDSTKYYSDKSFGLYPANDQFDVNTTDDFDELDAGTSDSSEPDLLWQFNHSKLGGFSNGTGPKVQKPNIKQSKSPEFRTMIPKLGPSPSRKAVREGGQGHPPPRSGRQTTETKRKTGSRK